MNAITINGGYVYVTPTALNAATAVGADLPALLRDGGLDVHDGDEEGKTVWNAQGRRGIHALDPSWHDEAVVSELLLQWQRDTCPDCDVQLMPLRHER
jgi:hypothetical protein